MKLVGISAFSGVSSEHLPHVIRSPDDHVNLSIFLSCRSSFRVFSVHFTHFYTPYTLICSQLEIPLLLLYNFTFYYELFKESSFFCKWLKGWLYIFGVQKLSTFWVNFCAQFHWFVSWTPHSKKCKLNALSRSVWKRTENRRTELSELSQVALLLFHGTYPLVTEYPWRKNFCVRRGEGRRVAAKSLWDSQSGTYG